MPEPDGRHVSENFIGRNRLAGCPTTLDLSSAIMRVWQLMGPNSECGIIDACSRGSKSSCSY
jgi:hypothetical protein